MQPSSANHSISINVVYLSWIPYGIDLLKEFIDSYRQFPADAPHRLTIIFNGVSNESDYLPFLDLAEKELNTRINFFLMEKGQDIDAYYFAARQLKEEHILFLNSFSRILVPGWLKIYLDAFSAPGTGLIAATASYQSHCSTVFKEYSWTWESEKGFLFNYRKYKLLIKAGLYWRFIFGTFPNRHIRTSAFMVKRELFLSIKYKSLTSKFRAYIFESGRNGFTVQVIKKGYKAAVIDKNGALFDMDKFHLSKTFWIEDQQNLLIADNQTKLYNAATPEEKKNMTRLAWGNYA